jgi:hypothetical protein
LTFSSLLADTAPSLGDGFLSRYRHLVFVLILTARGLLWLLRLLVLLFLIPLLSSAAVLGDGVRRQQALD